MAKATGKKRRRNSAQNVDLLCNITGVEGLHSQADDSTEACLAAMEGAQQHQSGDEQTPSNIMSKNGVAYSSASAKPRAHDNVWKRAMKEWVMNGKCTEGLRLPNPQAEVSRHFQTHQLVGKRSYADVVRDGIARTGKSDNPMTQSARPVEVPLTDPTRKSNKLPGNKLSLLSAN